MKLLKVEGGTGHVPQCFIAGDATVFGHELSFSSYYKLYFVGELQSIQKQETDYPH